MYHVPCTPVPCTILYHFSFIFHHSIYHYLFILFCSFIHVPVNVVSAENVTARHTPTMKEGKSYCRHGILHGHNGQPLKGLSQARKPRCRHAHAAWSSRHRASKLPSIVTTTQLQFYWSPARCMSGCPQCHFAFLDIFDFQMDAFNGALAAGLSFYRPEKRCSIMQMRLLELCYCDVLIEGAMMISGDDCYAPMKCSPSPRHKNAFDAD